MNDKDRDLVQQVLQAVGQAGEHGFSYLVRWEIMDGIVGVVACIAVLALLYYLFQRLLAWKPRDDDGHVPRGIGFVAVSILAVVFICCLSENVAQILAPEGAAIHAALHHCH